MPDNPKPRILVVEDDPDLVKILTLQLRSEGFRVTTAANGQEAYALSRQKCPDCIVLDLMMPVMDGFQFLKRIRSLDRTSGVPVIVLTASADERLRRKSELFQANAFFRKPYDLQELTRCLNDLCGGREVSSANPAPDGVEPEFRG